MTRRRLLGATAAVLDATRLNAQDHRPNILFLLADDWMWPHTSLSGEPGVRTPTFDRVAKSGVLFTNAHVAAPSCTPSRAAVLTGQWHWRLGEGANLGGTLPAKFPVYPDLLEAAGYHVGFTRKGWAPGVFEPGGRKRNPAGPRFDTFEDFLTKRKAGTPFCFWFGSTDPHRVYEKGSGVRSGKRLEDVRVPPYLPDNSEVRSDICDYFLAVERYDRDAGAVVAAVKKLGELENTIVVMAGDNGWPFPRSKATCYDTGTHSPLAISWPARVRGGRTVEDFVSLTDLAPTFLQSAGVTVPEQMTGRSLLSILTSGKSGRVDSTREYVLTGMERHVPSRGVEQGGYPMRTIRTRDFHFIRNFLPDRWPAGDPESKPVTVQEWEKTTFSGFADIDAGPSKAWVVTHRKGPYFEYAAGKRPARELYDLRSDPYELKNVAEDAKYKTIRERLEAQLMRELKATSDPRANGGGDEFDRYVWYQGRGLRRQP